MALLERVAEGDLVPDSVTVDEVVWLGDTVPDDVIDGDKVDDPRDFTNYAGNSTKYLSER